MFKFILIKSIFCVISILNLQAQKEKANVLLRLDDIGMSHAANAGLDSVLAAEIPVSASVMTCCPWFNEAVHILKQHPDVAVGIHLTLNAEWENYKWGPVLGQTRVPSLVDKDGYFRAEPMMKWANKADLFEMEKEFRAQIKKALLTGLRIDYIDNHMGAGLITKQHREIVLKLAKEYNFGVSMWLSEEKGNSFEAIPMPARLDSIQTAFKEMQAGKTYLFIAHPSIQTEESKYIIANHPYKIIPVYQSRQETVDLYTFREFKKIANENNIKFLSYREFITQSKIDSMKNVIKASKY